MSGKKSAGSLPGFRDLYPENCAVRNYLFGIVRDLCRCYGFQEYEGPTLESTDLYRKKSGDEVVEQLFAFTDRGERDVALRPELTPTLARMIAARQRDYKKPMRWFSIGSFFRYERPSKGRLREFYQFNCDILGESAVEAEAELIALSIDLMRRLGFTKEHFAVRLSDRRVWTDYLKKEGISDGHTDAFLQIIDKLERVKPEVSDQGLKAMGLSLDKIRAFMESGEGGGEWFENLCRPLKARGMADYVELDLGIVRGLAYYTGTVFEVFDKGRNLRAVAGGGRYDQLIGTLSDGKAELPAAGFAMGDVVVTELIDETPVAKARMKAALADSAAVDAYVVVADETKRDVAFDAVQRLREKGLSVHYSFSPLKVGKQFQVAEQAGARVAVVLGSEFPLIKVKNLSRREERECEGLDALPDLVRTLVRESMPSSRS
ncbi:MAG: histidine--tRNA ligase [Verrucomicrobiota bacterium]